MQLILLAAGMGNRLPKYLRKDPKCMVKINNKCVIEYLEEFTKYSREEIFEQRKKKFLNIGTEKSLTLFSSGKDWINKDNFFGSLKEILFDKDTLSRGLYNKDYLNKIIGKKDDKDLYDSNGKKIWMVINIELWLREFFDK